jgi:hypothetical protein
MRNPLMTRHEARRVPRVALTRYGALLMADLPAGCGAATGAPPTATQSGSPAAVEALQREFVNTTGADRGVPPSGCHR